MDHGWDDDLDDLDIEEEEGDTPDHPTAVVSQGQETEYVKGGDGGGGGGWEEDKDLFGDDDGDDVDPHVGVLQQQQQQHNVTWVQPKSSKEGWGDDDDVLNFADDWGENADSTTGAGEFPRVRTPSPFAENVPSPFTAPNDDHSDNYNSDAVVAAESNKGGWEDDEELFGEEVVDTNVEQPMKTPSRDPPNARNDLLLKQLQDYVSSLDRMLSSINAILEYEYNTPEKAQELVKYYAERPGLAAYTRTKELPRMSYHVILPTGHVETNKQEIADHHLPDASLLARCANQSLLADLLQVLTGPDLVVRPQFLAICVAESCQFRLHYGDNERDMVQVNCMLELSLPVAEGPRLRIATIRATIAFSPKQHEPPMVKFKVDKIVVMLKESQYSKLQQVVNFLTTMDGYFDEVVPGHTDLTMQNAPADIFRDAFLEQSQQLMHQSKAGMKSALKDMESVIGLKSKFKAVQVGISKFLPDTNVLLEAEEEARRLATEREAQHALRLRPQSSMGAGVPVLSKAPPPSGGQRPSPLLHTVAIAGSVPKEEASRPRSILGGLVKTGWGALAKSIIIPDEDPAIYGPVSQQQPPPMFYRKEEPEKVQVPDKSAVLQPYQKPNQPPGRFHAEALTDIKGPGETTPQVGLDVPQQSEPCDVGLKQFDLSLEEESGDGWDDDLDLTTDIAADEEQDEGRVDNDDCHVASPQEVADGNETEDFIIAQHNKQSMASSTSVVSPSKIPSFSQSLSAPAKSSPPQKATARPSKIPTYSDSSPSKVRVATTPVPVESPQHLTSRPLVADISYNPEDDIIPTRRRWVNPRPDRAYVFAGVQPANKL